MGITIKQPGEATAAAKAGIAIGKGQRATEERARAEREHARAEQIQAQREARKTAMKWEQEKMLMRSQQDFQQELAERQWGYEKFNRAKAWEIEKLEMKSRIDFEREEGLRTKELDRIDAGLQQLEKEVESGRLSEEQVAPHKFRLEMKKYGYNAPVSLIKPPTEKEATPSQRLSAYKALQGEEFQEPNWLQRLLPGGKGELTPEMQEYKGMFEEIARGTPAGTISSGLPTPKTQQEYDAIPSGSQYIDSSGNVRTKR